MDITDTHLQLPQKNFETELFEVDLLVCTPLFWRTYGLNGANGMNIDSNAREQAQKQWNAKACGELAGDKNSVEYFRRVEGDRYSQQDWVHDYFCYRDFSGKRVLEIGVGQGIDLMQFAKAGATLFRGGHYRQSSRANKAQF